MGRFVLCVEPERAYWIVFWKCDRGLERRAVDRTRNQGTIRDWVGREQAAAASILYAPKTIPGRTFADDFSRGYRAGVGGGVREYGPAKPLGTGCREYCLGVDAGAGVGVADEEIF